MGWLQNRGGIAVWQSLKLANLDVSWVTPAKTDKGEPHPKPNSQVRDNPRIITDPALVVVGIDREVKRFHVAPLGTVPLGMDGQLAQDP